MGYSGDRNTMGTVRDTVGTVWGTVGTVRDTMRTGGYIGDCRVQWQL